MNVTVVMPARNEADLIAAAIRSVQAAMADVDPAVRCRLVVVADSCTDATATAAIGLLDPCRDRLVRGDFGTAGAARRIGTRVALRMSTRDPAAVWLANTDADTTVPVDWLRTQLDHARAGVVAVAGVVRLNERRNPSVHLVERFTQTYTIDPDWTHPHVHGANLGVRADAYLAAGGWRCLATSEDHDLWSRVRHVGAVVSDARICVDTDPRRVGRAPKGFARDLAALDGAA